MHAPSHVEIPLDHCDLHGHMVVVTQKFQTQKGGDQGMHLHGHKHKGQLAQCQHPQKKPDTHAQHMCNTKRNTAHMNAA